MINKSTFQQRLFDNGHSGAPHVGGTMIRTSKFNLNQPQLLKVATIAYLVFKGAKLIPTFPIYISTYRPPPALENMVKLIINKHFPFQIKIICNKLFLRE